MEDNTPHDELMDEPVSLDSEIHEVFFQFNEEEPVKIAYVAGENFSLTLETGHVEQPTIVFADGKGKEFKLFLKKADGVQ